MDVTVNGNMTELDDDMTVGQLVESRTEEQRRVAVALNGDVVPRSSWRSTRLAPGDSIEVLVAVAGG